jgi:hypothetical protein
MSIIQQLKNEGVLKLWHHYKRHSVDLSGNDSNGIHSGTKFTGDGLQFGSLSVADSASLQGTTWTLVQFGRKSYVGSTNQGLLSKRDAGGTQYDWFQSGAAQLSIYDGTNTRTLAATIEGSKYQAVSFEDGSTPEGWTDGLTAGSYSGTVAISADDAPLIIGNLYDGSRRNFGVFKDTLAISRILTGPEHLTLYAEFQSLERCFDSRPWAIPGGTVWHQRLGVYESVANLSTPNKLENSGFKIPVGNSFVGKIVHEVVSGQLQPVIECVTTGLVSIPTSYFHQTASEAAYGMWEWWMYSATGNTTIVSFIHDSIDIAGAGNNYNIVHRSFLDVDLRAIGSTIIAGHQYPKDAWNNIKSIRTGANLFDVFINNTSIGTVTDSSYTISNYVNLQLQAGDKISGFIKRISA